MKNLLTYSLTTIGVTAVLISATLTNTNIKGIEAVGIVSDNIDMQKVVSSLTLDKTAVNCDEIENGKTIKNTCIKNVITFKGIPVKVFVVGNTASMQGITFPFTGKLIGDNIQDPEGRLIQMMEEQGINKYTIIK